MTDASLAASFWFLMGAFGLIGLLYLYKDYRIDRLRDEIFALRDDLFDYAVEQKILDQSAYRELRQAFNGMLRFCHKISFFRLSLILALDVLYKDRPKRTPLHTMLDASDLSQEQKIKLKAFHVNLFILVLRYMADTSVVLCPIITYFRIKDVVGKMFHHAGHSLFPELFKKTERGWQLIEEQALETTR